MDNHKDAGSSDGQGKSSDTYFVTNEAIPTDETITEVKPNDDEARIRAYREERQEIEEEKGPRVALGLPFLKPPSFHEVADTADEEVCERRTFEMKAFQAHYSDKLEADMSVRKPFKLHIFFLKLKILLLSNSY